MTAVRLLTMLLLLVGAPTANAKEGEIPLAERFVQAMKLDSQSAIGLHMAGDNLRREGKIDDTQVACIKQVGPEAFAPLMSQLANAQLTADEMQKAILFFESSAGKKYLQMSEVKSAEKMGAKSAATMPDFTASEYRATNEFAATPLFQKLVNEAVMTRSAVARPQINAKVVELIRGCISK